MCVKDNKCVDICTDALLHHEYKIIVHIETGLANIYKLGEEVTPYNVWSAEFNTAVGQSKEDFLSFSVSWVLKFSTITNKKK